MESLRQTCLQQHAAAQGQFMAGSPPDDDVPSSENEASAHEHENAKPSGSPVPMAACSDAQLLDRLHSGELEAMNVVAQRYDEFIARVASRQLQNMPRVRFNTDDVVGSTFRTFLRRATNGEYTLDPDSELRGLLKEIASAVAKKRDFRREVPLNEGLGQQEAELARRGPTLDADCQEYAEAVVAVMRAMLEDPAVPDEQRAYLAKCLEEGLQRVAEIARAMGVTERIVSRIRRDIRVEIVRRLEGGGATDSPNGDNLE